MKTKEQKIIKFIKRHFEDTSAIGYEPYTLDKEYPQSHASSSTTIDRLF